MTLAFEQVDVPITGGVDEGTHEFAVQPLRLKSLINGRFRKINSVSKRYGYTALSPTIDKVHRMFSYGDKLCAIQEDGSGHFRIRTRATGQTIWTEPEAYLGGDKLPAALLTERSRLSAAGHQQYMSDGCVCNGQRIVVYTEWPDTNPAVRCTVVDDTTGAVIFDSETLDIDGRHGKVCVQGNTVRIVWWSHTTATTLRTCSYDTTTRAFTAASDLITDYTVSASASSGNGDSFDLAPVSSSIWVLVYRSATPDITAVRYSGTTASHTITIGEDPVSVGVQGTNNENVWIGWYTAVSGTRVGARLASDLTSVLAATTIDTATTTIHENISFSRISSTQVLVAHTREGQSGTPGTFPMIQLRTVTTAGVLGTAHFHTACRLYSRLYTTTVAGATTHHGITQYLGVSSGTTQQPAFHAVEFSADGATNRVQPVHAQFCRGEATRQRQTSGLTTVTSRADGENKFFAVDAAWVTEPTGKLTSVGVVGPNTIDLSYDSEKRFATARLGRSVYIAGAVLSYYDGVRSAEVGFHYPPDDSTMSLLGAGGSLSTGDYAVAVVYEYATASGEREFSTPVLARDSGGAVSIAATAGDGIRVRVQSLNHTRKVDPGDPAKAPVQVHVYITEANGDVFYRATSLGAPEPNSYGSTTAVTVDITTSDATVRNRPKLYTYAGVLAHFTPPPCEIICAHRNRLFVVDSEDPKTIWFSKEHVDGEVPGFSPVNQITIQEGGPITGLASLDDRLVVFKQNSTYVVRGTFGPDDTGLNSDYAVDLGAADVGCRDWRSIAVIPQGVIRLSERGFHLYDRGGNDTYIGRDVEDTLASAGTVTSACVLPKQREVRWTCNNGESVAPVIVFQYDIGAWSTDTIASVSSCIWDVAHVHGDVYHIATSATASVGPHSETTAFSDPGSVVIATTLETAWMKTAGFQGFQRCRNVMAIGKREGAHDLAVSLGYNYATSYATTRSFTNAELVAMDRWQPRVHVPQQKSEAIRVKIVDTPSSVSGGFTLVALGFEMGRKPGRMRLPAAHAK